MARSGFERERFDRYLAGATLLFLACVAVAVAAILVHDRNWQVLLLVLVAAAGLWALNSREARAVTGANFSGRNVPASRAPLITTALIFIMVFVSYVPILRAGFQEDDFGCLHAFSAPSLGPFWRMFHTSLTLVVEGAPGNELRPFYALYYLVSYRLWGLNPLGYHLVAIFVHVLNALIVAWIAKELIPGNPWRAGLAGLLYAVCPTFALANSVITLCPGEAFPTLFFLVTFVFFMRYRATSRPVFLVASLGAFALCLISKEIAMVLPVMLVFYDLLQFYLKDDGSESHPGWKESKARYWPLAANLPFFVLLLGYLGWRHVVFIHSTGASLWIRAAGVDRPASQQARNLWQLVVQIGQNLINLQAFNIRNLLLPLPSLALGFVLAFYLVSALRFLEPSARDRRTTAVFLYCGVVWYVISVVPLLVVTFDVNHLYPLAVGPCIALAILVMPPHLDNRMGGRRFAVAGAALLVAIFAGQLWIDNAEFKRSAEELANGRMQMMALLAEIPQNSVVVMDYPEENFLPFALQSPFAPGDLYSRHRIVAFYPMYGWTPPEWWENTRKALIANPPKAPDGPVDLYLLAWEPRSRSVQERKRSVTGFELRDYLKSTVGDAWESKDSIPAASADQLVLGLVQLIRKPA